jgi:hypothetical protein
MQILEIILYSHRGEIRRLPFHLGRLNIVTGVSGTGKSAILEIIHYCLGDENDFRVPSGVITQVVAWYAIRVGVGGTEVFIARPSPDHETVAKNAVALTIGEEAIPALGDLEPTTTVEALNDLLGRLIGIEENVQTPYRSARPDLQANFRHSLFYCFQRQYEIANPEFLFHRQTHSFVKLAIQDTLPYFLGAAERNQVEQQRQLRALRRELRLARQRLDELVNTRSQALDRGLALISEAREVGLSAAEGGLDTLSAVNGALIEAANARPTLPELSPAAGRELARVEGRRLELSGELRRVREEIDFVRLLTIEQDGFAGIVSEQVSRLTSLNLITDGTHVCPVCEQPLTDHVPTVDQLNELLAATSRKLESHQREVPHVQDALAKLEARQEGLTKELDETQRALQALITQRNEVERFRGVMNAQSYVRGRVAQYLDAVGEADEQAIAAAQVRITDLERSVAEAEERLSPENIRERVERILDVVGQDMQTWAIQLQLEHSESPVRIQPSDLTVVAATRRGRIPLQEMGSGASWVGYHLVAHLALHKQFIDERRPVPRFVILDQITQVFYPPEQLPDESYSALSGDDQNRVHGMFALLNQVVGQLAGELQVIVMDHARIPEDWFLDSVVADWHEEGGLIPASWMETDGN